MIRLDRFMTGGVQFHKPRHGVCGLCGRPAIEHPCVRHRIAAYLATR